MSPDGTNTMAEQAADSLGPGTGRRYYAVSDGKAGFLDDAIGETTWERATELREGIGLGIDAGGTYTDAILYDFAARAVLAAAKALTTHGNPAIGIGHALDSLPRGLFPEIRRVSLATTFATNAIVEGKGRKVGLLLAGYDDYDMAGIGHYPRRVLKGRHDIMGNLLEDLDGHEVAAAVRDLVEREGVEAFAITSVGACRNPEHEHEIKAILRGISALPVVMGHELSSELDRLLRATTTVLNARISPLISELSLALERELKTRGIGTPLTIVRADGSLMNLAEAVEKPIEMILSGPAASAQGALRLAGTESGLVVDMGGTTSDVAITARGRPVMSGRGAVIGEHRTAVRTLKSSSIGLGGDSEVRIERGQLRVGPRRILPISYATAMDERVRSRHSEVAASPLAEIAMMHPAQVFVLASEPANEAWLEPRERAVLRALREGPKNILDLSRALDYPFLSSIPVKRLEDFGYVMRCGFTPTDLLHAEGGFLRWDARSATEALAAFSARMGLRPEACGKLLREAITEKLMKAVLVEGIADSGRPRKDSELALAGLGERFWAGTVSGKADGAFVFSTRLELPIIGVGAPMAAFLPDLARRLGTTAVCPEHADTAGAVGAVISAVTEELDLLIRPKAGGGYSLFGPDFKFDHKELEAAKKAALGLALEGITEKARSGGLGDFIAEISVEDESFQLEFGPLYMETTVRAAARMLLR
jgi:N-methylhydantoinase A/oxoprolinase/acetone carboxylase beta subunit